MMFIPILLLTMILGSGADVMQPDQPDVKLTPPKPTQHLPGNQEILMNTAGEDAPPRQVKLSPDEEVHVKSVGKESGEVISAFPMVGQPTIEELKGPGRDHLNCIDCAVAHLPESVFSVKVPKLDINFEVKEFPSAHLIVSNLISSVRKMPIFSYSSPTTDVRLKLKALASYEVHVSIPKLGWSQVLKLSDVVSGLKIPPIPVIGPKVESCGEGCVES
ncbi:putative silencing suppressor [Tomato necrotic spot virus]|uniref:Silencing suppressor n=1 Tax=Tomato necrotic spot virus TaxID=568804 RepID=A0A3G2JTV5_9BROM|nr:putative silencing suppressor [Tomato necrotic spot virus]